MSKPFVRNTLNTTIENQIAIASIVSTNFLSRIAGSFDPEYIINDYVRTICKWSVDYFNQYEIAPNANIKPIYEVEKHGLDKAESELIATVLSKLSSEYANGEGINEEYIFDNTINYFNDRDLTLRLERACQLRDAGRLSDARNALDKKSPLEKILSKWTKVFGYDDVLNTYNRETNELMKLPGALGDMIGSLERGWLLGILGGFKRGKTMYMMEFAIQAMVSKLKVAFISLEMTDHAMKDRFYKRITGLGKGDIIRFPLFDCLSNQLGVCKNVERCNTVTLIHSIKDEIVYKEGYVPCTVCRGKQSKEYIPAPYYEEIQTDALSVRRVFSKMKAFEMMFGNNLRCMCYPRFSASVDDIERDLHRLETEHEFIPDVIVIDYATIMKPGRYGGQEKRNILDDIWMNLARVAGEKHCLVVTGSQGTRGSLKKDQMSEEDIAEWIGILGHVDVMLALNQSSIEKENGMIRINTLAHRHKDFNPEKNVIVLQKLDVGQTLLDSEYERR